MNIHNTSKLIVDSDSWSVWQIPAEEVVLKWGWFLFLDPGESLRVSAEGGTRTHTFRRTPDFESGTSTNFITPAVYRAENLLFN